MAQSIRFQAYLSLAAFVLATPVAFAQHGSVGAHFKISNTQGNFTGVIDDVDLFGRAVTSVGDLDGDGIVDAAVGAQLDDDGGVGATADRGAVWILFLNADGTVKSHQKISDTEGGFTGVLDDGDRFGSSLACLGDLNRDGIVDLAVGAPRDDDGGADLNADRGAVWILFLNANGTVKSHLKIAAANGGFGGALDDGDEFGIALGFLGDLDGDQNGDLAVGAFGDDDGGADLSANRGAAWVLLLNQDGTVKAHQKISDTAGGFTGVLDDGDGFGVALAKLDDMDSDGNVALAIGAFNDDDGAADRGAVWVLFLNADGTVKSHQKISETSGGFTGDLDQFDAFGITLAAIGDLDADGVPELAVGANGDGDGGGSRGAIWILFLNADATVASIQKISSTMGGFTGSLDNNDAFGIAAAPLGDLDGDGLLELMVGAIGDDDGGIDNNADRGAVWILKLDGVGYGDVLRHRKISDTAGGFTGILDNFDQFGTSGAAVGDLDGDGVVDMIVGAPSDDDGSGSSVADRGALWLLYFNADGSVKSHKKISDTVGGFTGVLDDGDNFGVSVAALGDVDGDGVIDLAVGALFDDDGGTDRGAVWILLLNANGSVKGHRKISASEGGFVGVLADSDNFGMAVAALDDLDGDGVPDLAVGAPGDNDGGADRGAAWILFLNADGSVKSHQKISATQGGFLGVLDNGDAFGDAIASLGDLDGDGIIDLAVSALMDDDGGTNRGAVWILFLNTNGTVKSRQKISMTAGNFTGTLDQTDFFGDALVSLGDLDGDGVGDLAVGALADDDGGVNRGAVWLLMLNSDGTVRTHQKISATDGHFTGSLDNGDNFGSALAVLPDLDRDGSIDVAVGARFDDDGGSERGAVWLLSLKTNLLPPGSVRRLRKISDTHGYFDGVLDDGDVFGQSVAPIGDVDGDGVIDLAVGAIFDVNGGITPGAVWVLFMTPRGTVRAEQKIDAQSGGFTGILDDFDRFGQGVAPVGDLDGDGVPDLAVGSPSDDDGGSARGAVWILFLNANGTVKSHLKIGSNLGGFDGDIDDVDTFGSSLAKVDDLDGDGIDELAVGAVFDDDGGSDVGAVWILFLRTDGTVRTYRKISETEGGFVGALDDGDRFGQSIACLGDVDGDGIADIAIGAVGDDDGGAASNANRGAVWIVFLNADGTAKGQTKISDTLGGFGGILDNGDAFGSGVAAPSDLDGDGVPELLVGAALDGDGGASRGAAWLLFLNPNGTVREHRKISDTAASLGGSFLENNDNFGSAIASLGDLNGDGVFEIGIGAPADDDGGALATSDRGAIWILTLSGVPALDPFTILDANPTGNTAPDTVTNQLAVTLRFDHPLALGVALHFSQDAFATSTTIFGSGRSDVSLTLNAGGDGVRTVHARLSNAHGRNEAVSAATLLDRIAPTAATPTDIGVFTGNTQVTFNWTAPTDGGSGIAASTMQIGAAPGGNDLFDGSVLGLTSKQIAGAHGQTLYARLIVADNAGNVTTTANSDGITIDTTAPIAQTPTDDGSFTNSTEVTFNWVAPTDAVSGIASTILQVGAAPNGSDIFNGNVTGLTSRQVTGADGQTLYARLIVTDNVGNVTTTPASNGITIDTSLPTAQPPTDQGVFSLTTTVTFLWEEPVDEISGIASVVLQVGTAPGSNNVFEAEVIGQTSQQVTGADGQTLYARLVVTDNLGNIFVTSSTDGITIDVSSPVVQTPTDIGVFSTSAQITFNWALPIDAVSGVAAASLQIGTAPGSANLFNGDVTGLTSKQIAGVDGQTMFARLIVSDNAGNVATTGSSDGIRIDISLPVVQPPTDDGVFSTAALVTFGWPLPTDAVSGIASATIQVGTAPNGNDLFEDDVTGLTSQQVAGVDGQTLYARLIVADLAGNTTTTASSNGIMIDTVAPAAAVPTDAGAFSTGTLITFNWTTPTDAVSGIASTVLRIGSAPGASDLFNADVTGTTSRQIVGADGQALYARLIVTDAAGNVTTTADSDGITIDVSLPAVQTPTDAGDFKTTTQIVFNWPLPTDAVSGIASTVLQIGSAPDANDLFEGDVTGLMSHQIVGIEGQTLYARLIATDVAGNAIVTPSSDGITVDTTPPTVGAPVDPGVYSTSTLILFDWPAPTDAVSGVAVAMLHVGTVPGASDVFVGNVTGLTFKQVAGADTETLYAHLIVADVAGNVAFTGSSDGITIDVSDPVALTPTDDGMYSSTTQIVFNWALPTDDVSGVDSTILQIGSAPDGNELFEGDVTGLTSHQIVGVDGQTLHARLIVGDVAGNTTTTASSDGITVDITVPAIQTPTDKGEFSTSTLVTFTWPLPTDAVSGIATTILQAGTAPGGTDLFDGDVTGKISQAVLGEDGQTLYARLIATDNAGNTTATQSSDGITIDVSLPVVNPPTDDGEYSTSSLVTFQWDLPDDAVSIIASSILQIGAAPDAGDLLEEDVTTRTTLSIVGEDGQTLFARLIVTDVAGNSTTTLSSDGITIDISFPVAQTPADAGLFSTTSTIEFVWPAPGDVVSGIDYAMLQVGTTPGASDILEDDVTTRTSVRIDADDGQTLYARLIVADIAGNVTTTAASDGITIDISRPVVQPPIDAGAYSTTSTVTFQWPAPTDAVSGIASSILQIGSTPGANDLLEDDVSTRTALSIVADDGRTLYARLIVADVAGNTTTTASTDGILVDISPPVFVAPTDAGVFSTSTLIAIDWPLPTDAVSGIASTTLQLGTTPGANDLLDDDVTSLTTFQYVGVDGLTIYARLVIADAAGNTTATQNTDGITIDASFPVAQTPTDAGLYSTSSQTIFTWTMPTDAVSGVASTILRIGSFPNGNDLFDAAVGTSTSRAIVAADGVTLYARLIVADAAGNVTTTANSDGITIDTTTPKIAVDFQETKNAAPEITGTIDDPTATIRLRVAHLSFDAVNHGATWSATLPEPLPEATYDVRATATDPAGNVGIDPTLDELIIQITPIPKMVVLHGSTVIPNGGGPIDFGLTTLGLTDPSRTFTVRNDGDSTLTIVNLFVTGNFVISEALNDSIGEGQSDDFTVMFQSGAVGSNNGMVQFSTNDAKKNPFQFSVKGRLAAEPDGGVGSLINFMLGLSTQSTGLDFNEDGSIDSADIQWQLQRIPPAAPFAPVPDDREGGIPPNVVLGWKSNEYATSFNVWLWPIEESQPATPAAVGLPTPFFAPPDPLEYSRTYRWQVLAVGPVRTQVGPVWRFTVKDPPPPPPPPVRLVSPNGGQTFVVGGPIEIQWERTPEAGTAWRVELWRNSQLVALVGIFHKEELSGTETLTVPEVPFSDEYYVRLTNTWLEDNNHPQAFDSSDGFINITRP